MMVNLIVLFSSGLLPIYTVITDWAGNKRVAVAETHYIPSRF